MALAISTLTLHLFTHQCPCTVAPFLGIPASPVDLDKWAHGVFLKFLGVALQ